MLQKSFTHIPVLLLGAKTPGIEWAEAERPADTGLVTETAHEQRSCLIIARPDLHTNSRCAVAIDFSQQTVKNYQWGWISVYRESAQLFPWRQTYRPGKHSGPP